ncbi:lysozyme inhibitor LprI family protein [Glacieibacterium megasporae]|uniref:lysozyme inhibitor LprI family protein n=1 Tax=Glacieibacterium megasporae TaxID=2835787 RepID=UPI001C1DEEF7|nr:lysozyme inhibitor LprI family protein [Polymorphobacter megasporae]UAJ09542.1 lysozyme inhibitor LprI family protein [Polymorphobacter megasporae]
MIGIVVALALVTAPNKPAQRAEDCYHKTDSHVAEAACESMKADGASRKLQRYYRQVFRAAAEFSKTTSTISFTKQIQRNQARWSLWAADECRLEGEVTMGSAAITIEPICRQRLSAQRLTELKSIGASFLR